MYARKQQGKGLTGFLFGLILATAAIGGIVFMLNNNKNKDFKQIDIPEQPVKTETEKLAPPAVSPESVPSDSDQTGIQESGRHNDAEPTPDSEPEAKLPEKLNHSVIRPNTEAKPQPAEQRESVNKHTPANTSSVPKDKAQAQHNEPQAESKPTPEQILNSGSIEKARRDLQQQKEKAAAPADTADKRIKIQAGSFSDRSGAEAQRAKIALLGVHTQIVEAQSNGRTVYRVQTGTLDGKQAAKTASTLEQNGIHTISR